MKKIWLNFTIIISFVITGCASSPNVYTDFDPQQDFSQYKTFTWISDEPLKMQTEAIISPLVEQRIVNAVKANMEAKGYTYVEFLDDADMALSFTVGSREKIRTMIEPNFMVTNAWRWGGHYWGFNAPLYTESTRVYKEGSLAIDVFDNTRKQPVWHGVSSKNLTRERNAGESEFINQAVADTLAAFPNQGQLIRNNS